MGILDWSATAADNDNADASINWLEGQAPSTVNNSSRAMMAALAKWFKDNNGTLTTGGSSSAYTVTTNNAYSSLVDGALLCIEANHANTGASTLNADAIGAVAIVQGNDEALTAGNIVSGGRYLISYDSGLSKWLLLNPSRPDIVAVTNANNNFTSGQTVTIASNDANIVATRTGTNPSGAFMGAHADKAVFGSNTPDEVELQVNGIAHFSLSTGWGLYTSSLSAPAVTGGINVSNVEVGGSTIPFQRYAASSALSSASGGLVSLAHGFSAVPRSAEVHAVCGTAEGGYSIGDRIVLNPGGADAGSTNSKGLSTILDATNVLVRVGSSGFANLFNRTTGVVFTPTPANWSLYIYAYGA